MSFQEFSQPAFAWARPSPGRRALHHVIDRAPAPPLDADALDAIRRQLGRQVLLWYRQCRSATRAVELAATLDGLVGDLRILSVTPSRQWRAARLRAACRSHADDLHALAQRLREGATLDVGALQHGVDALLVELELMRPRHEADPARPFFSA